jgi:ferric-dicitrate binding protein FerR (iron transport regulator)
MNTDINNIWRKICSYFSNDLSKTVRLFLHNPLTLELQNSAHVNLFNITEKDAEMIESTNYMFDQETDNAWSSLHNKINEKSSEQRTIRFYQKPFFRIAASIVFILGIFWISYSTFIQSKFEITETRASHLEKVLPDGTTVYLNANSSIKFPKHFSANNRKVELSGEAFFNVKKDAKRPFIIKAEDAIIKVLGTSFNVNTNNKVEVLVKTGKVSLSSVFNNKKLILTKGEFGILKNQTIEKVSISDINYLSWKTQLLDFRDAPLSYVIDVINKTYTENIFLDGKKTSELRLYAKFDKAPLNTVLESICLTFNLEYEQIDGEIKISNKSD